MAVTEILKEDSKSNHLYDDENERRLHLDAVKMLALRIGASQADVERVYEIVLRRIKRGAKVKDFLPVLVGRRVEYLLNKRRSGKENASGN
jgi:hypothetical protein